MKTCRRACTNTSGAQFGSERKSHDLAADPFRRALLSGRTGSGKSTVLDAVDFALTGSINKFSVKSARGGGLEQHIWWVGPGKADAHYVAVGFVDADGKGALCKSRPCARRSAAGQTCNLHARDAN
jgi:energy-coupling factor transporter ATP-binding protein EcfA2